MERKHTEEDFRAIARQLSCPKGEHGIKTGEMMHSSNLGMTCSAIDGLQLKGGEKVLEIGHGNAGHLNYFFAQSPESVFFGIDISETISAEAKKLNKHFIEQKKASFFLTNGDQIPFSDGFFDKIFTVNTIYFWKDAKAYLKEIKRVLKPGGTLIIAFAERTFMETLPFTPYGFTLYDEEKLTALVKEANLNLNNTIKKTERIKSNTGLDVLRKYFVVSIS